MTEFQTLLQILKRRFWMLVLIPLLAVAATLAFDMYSTPVYQSNVRMLVHADKALLQGRDLIYGYYSLDQASIVATFVELANSRRIFGETATALGISGPLQERVSLTTVALPNSTVLELSARAPDPSLAQQMANTAGGKMVELVNQFYSGYTIEVLDQAFMPRIPVDPNPVRDGAVALVLGLALATGLALLDHALRQGLTRARQGGVYDAASSAVTRSYLEKQLKEHAEARGQEGALAIVRLNGLKGVKGRMSRSMYDRLLRYVVSLMVGELRGKDIVARWNDASFAIFMPRITTPEAVKLLESVQSVLEQPQRFPASGPWIYFDPRVGAVTTGTDYQVSTLIQEAEAALSRAGMNGSKPVIAAGQATGQPAVAYKEVGGMR